MFAARNVRLLARLPNVENVISGTSRRDMATYTGTVKFYRRQQAFGFIQVDGGNDEDDGAVQSEVFVHRNSISARDDAEGNIYYPFLRTDERVAFEIEAGSGGDGRPVAKDVTFEDGSIVPTVRQGYALGYRKGVTKRFGEKLFDIMDSGEKTDEELLQLIHSYHKEASVEIVKAEELERNNNPNYGKEQSKSDATSESETQNQ